MDFYASQDVSSLILWLRYSGRMVLHLALLGVGALLGPAVIAQTIPTIPAVLPVNWTSVGCFSDISTSRTLAATSLVQDPMTIETCLGFCDSGGFLFAGIEFGHCDSTIQIPSTPEPATDCNMACSGNASELCGGPVRMNIFQSNRPPPVIVQNVTAGTGLWTYQGCFTDSTGARTLGTGVNIPLGTTPESCTAACLAQGAFTFAGVENGHECWCDTTVHAPTQRVGDADCRELCQANHGEYCGNANRVAVYEFSPTGKAPGPQVCLDTTLSNFTLRAQFKNPPLNGPSSVPLKVVAVEIVKNILWTVISVRVPYFYSTWMIIILSNSIISPHSIVIPTQQMTSTFTNDGESPNFVASIPAFPGSQSYCTMTDTAAVIGSPPILAFNGKADAFSLCTNTSANARVDLVFSPVTGHPHYTLDTCQPVNVQVIT
ncbi:hypothetical protein CVT25_000426 [Psilocybe cyanescens]|uniref:WSC domain-containing protein n=1 Tax=Psilocybe cyanescens TaxID=93625 RepID=A0A409XM08_PSICY|nr:hypothetical protein CVT25_000426 [Psilocybe cyanescens]